MLGQQNRTRHLGRISAPTVVLHGLHDPLVDVSGGLALAQAIPAARVYIRLLITDLGGKDPLTTEQFPTNAPPLRQHTVGLAKETP